MGPGRRPRGHGGRRANPAARGRGEPVLAQVAARSLGRSCRLAVGALALASALEAGPVWAFGSLLTSSSEPMGLVAARALVVRAAGGRPSYTFQAAFRFGDSVPNRVAWVVPIPAGGEARVGSCAVFDALEELAAPVVLVHERQPAEACTRWEPVLPEPSPIGAFGWPEGTAEASVELFWPETMVELAVLLADRLEVVVPSRAWQVLGYYLDNGFGFAIVTPSEIAGATSLCLEASYDWGATPYLLPMSSATVGASENVELTVYAVDRTRVEPPAIGSHYLAVELERDAVRLDAADRTNYEALFVRAVGTGTSALRRYFVVEFSGRLPADLVESDDAESTWLTRLRTRLAPSEIVADLPLQRGGVPPREVDRTHSILVASARGARGVPAGAALAALALAGCFGFGRLGRRRRPG